MRKEEKQNFFFVDDSCDSDEVRARVVCRYEEKEQVMLDKPGRTLLAVLGSAVTLHSVRGTRPG